MRYVVEAEYLGKYRIWLKFDNGAEKIVDLEGELEGAVFEPLRDVDVFRKVSLNSEADTITWENGADFAPEFLYGIGVSVDSVRGQAVGVGSRK